ncbi:MAG: GNAT family N-acetyltransferase [Nitrospirae bacterium]|nr:GNAT family N-acetyltransferase [Nitrospirota bacterium]
MSMQDNDEKNQAASNLLEPEELAEAFLAFPPDGFEPFKIACGNKTAYGFVTEFDIFTTVDGWAKKAYIRCVRFFPRFILKLFRPKVLFIGTTVTEYSPLPYEASPKKFADELLAQFSKMQLPFLIVKDIPFESPLLSVNENSHSLNIIKHLEDSGFTRLSGQALSYVPINFSSIEDYLQRFSRSRRKDFKRKLRSRSELSVEDIKTGDAFFSDDTIDLLYSLYSNVYEQSYIHFDKLSRDFFATVFRDSNGGIVFVYKCKDKIIGFNLCFVYRNALVDKYVGFVYPDSMELNLYFVSWFNNLEYCIKRGFKTYIAGWTDPEVKAYLGADFTFTYHCFFAKSRFLRLILQKIKGLFESDKRHNTTNRIEH